MFSKIFAAPDAIAGTFAVGGDATVIDGVDSGTVIPLSTLLNEIGIGSWELNLNLNGSTGGASFAFCEVGTFFDVPVLIQEWTVDYDRLVDPIPNNAKIKS